MNSIEQLNLFANLVEFTDPRATNVLFSKGTPDDGTQTVLEGLPANAYYGIDIVEIRNYASVNISYTVDISDIAGATLSFPDLPEHMSVDNTATGIYVVSGFESVFDWERVRSPEINFPFDYTGTATYDSRIDYLSTNNKSWTTTITVVDVIEWDTESPETFWFNTGSNLVDAPLLVDALNPVESWYVLVIPSEPSLLESISSGGAGGTATFDEETKVLTIQGTNAQINSHLSTLSFSTNGDVQEHFTLTYRATNIVYGQSDSVVQNIKSNLIRYFTAISPQTYNEDENFTISSPTISHDEAVGGETYTILITPSVAAAVDSISSAGTGGSTALNSTSKVYTIIGTKTQVNSHLSTLSINAGRDYAATYYFVYSFSVSTGASQNRNKFINLGTSHAEASNLGVVRNFVINTTNSIFATDPIQITDTDPEAVSYTVTMTMNGSISGIGVLDAPDQTSSTLISITGTKAEVNSWLTEITYTPGTNYFSNTTINYTQSKDGFTQINSQAITVNGPKVALNPPTPNNQNIAVVEGATHNVPVGTEIIGINAPSTNLPTYTIDVSAVPGTTVTWSTIPAGSSVTNPTAGVYRINNITTVAKWNDVKSPLIRLPNYYSGTFAYTASIGWLNLSESASWTVTTAVSNVSLLSTPSKFEYNSVLHSTIASAKILNGTPNLVDTGNQTLSYTVTITPSQALGLTTISNSFAQGNFNFNTSTKVATISGTLSQVNSILDSLKVRSNYPYDINYTLDYYARNSTLTETDVISQTVESTNISVLGAVRSHDTYGSGSAPYTITGGPLSQDTGTADQTLNIYPVPSSAVASLDIDVDSIPYETSTLPVTPDAISKNGDTFIQGLNIYRRTGRKTWALHHTLSEPEDFNPSTFDYFDGYSQTAHATQPSANVAVTISDDGNYIAIGHRNQITTGNKWEEGAVWIWARSGTTWLSQGKVVMPTWLEVTGTTSNYLSSSNPYFGTNLTFSSNGSTLAVGAPLCVTQNISATGRVGGIVAVYQRSVSTWSRQQILKDPKTSQLTNEYTYFGGHLDSQNNLDSGCLVLSSDGNVLVAGRGNNAVNGFTIFTRSGSTWTYKVGFGRPGTEDTGSIIKASGDCRVIAVGARFDSFYPTSFIVTVNSTYTTVTLANNNSPATVPKYVSTDGTKIVLRSTSGSPYVWNSYSSSDNFASSSLLFSTTVLSLTRNFIIDDSYQTLIRGTDLYVKYGPAAYNPTTKTLTITLDYTGLVALTDNIKMIPNGTANFELWYDLTASNGQRSIKNQRITYTP
jgi:hypothetical protein